VALLGAGMLVGSHLQRSREAAPEAAPAEGGGEAEADDAPRFVLLIYAPPGESSQPQQVRDEIGEWGRRLFREGVVEDGFGMSDERAWAGREDPVVTGNRRLTHSIRICAADLAEARRIAATLPLAARGGLVEVRPVD
jgi:YCII-related domain